MKFNLKVAFNSFSQFFSRVFSTLSILAATFLITQNLSKSLWGDFVTVTAYIALFALLADFGLNGVVVKKIVQEPEKEGDYFKQLLGLRIFLAIISIFLALAVLAFVPHSQSVKLGIVVGVFLIALQAIFNTSAVVFQSKLRYEQYAFSDIVGSLTTLMLVFLAVLFKVGLVGIILIFVIGAAVKTILGLVLAQRLLGSRGFGLNLSFWRTLLKAALPLGLVAVFSQINANIDKQIIALGGSDVSTGVSAAVAVGLYGIAYRVFDFAIALPTFIVNALYPSMLSAHKNEREVFADQVRSLALKLFAVGVAGAILGWILAPLIIGFFGDYQASVPSLRILLLGLPLFFVTSLFLWVTVTLGKEFFLPFIYAFAALANVVLNLILIPKFGFVAAAWVTVLTELVIGLALFLILLTSLDLLPKAGSYEQNA